MTTPTHPRVLAIAPSTRGYGYAVLEGEETLVDWGAKAVSGDKNAQCIASVEKLIAHYQPEVVVLGDHRAEGSRRHVRIRVLGQEIIDLAPKHNVSVALYSPEQINKFLLSKRTGTKQERAELLAKRFPEELGPRLPPKRKAWMKEDHRMDIFDAVSLALMPRERARRRIRASGAPPRFEPEKK